LTVAEAPVSPGPPVQIEVANLTLRLALCFVAEDAGYPRGMSADALVVSDTIPPGDGDRPVDVLVVDTRPVACQRAIGAVSAGTARSVICTDEPDRLPLALRGLEEQVSIVPRRVIECANRAPALSARLLGTLQQVAAGASNQKIATATHASVSTVKRDFAHLLDLFDAPNRLALTAAAIRLGYHFG
jgi:DNA-binding CsgD family transcriptional regulator